MRNIHLTTWKMTKSLKNVKNEKCPLRDLEYGEKTENHGKWEIHTLGREIWRGKLKKVENLETSTVGREIWRGKLKKLEYLEMSTVGHEIWQDSSMCFSCLLLIEDGSQIRPRSIV
jgi:hypothetical protein